MADAGGASDPVRARPLHADVSQLELTAGALPTSSSFTKQSRRLEMARRVLVAHGDADELLPLAASETVCTLAGGELVVLAGTGHLLIQASGELRDLLGEWIPRVLAG
jgi:hypothetical protein